MIPLFESGSLPPGIHQATWDETVERFGWNSKRLTLLDGVQRALNDLRSASCRRVWLNGSFVTIKDLPNDFDICWDMEGVEFDLLAAALKSLDHPRALQKQEYGGDVLPNVMEANSGQPFLDFFQEDPETGRARGVVELALGSKK